MRRVRRDRKLVFELEEFIVAAIDDATARITADVDRLIAALAAAQGTGTGDTANAAALNAAADRAENVLSPPAPAAGTTETGTTTGTTAEGVTPEGALTPPA